MSDDEDEEEEEESPAKKGVQINSNKQDAAPSTGGGAPQSKLARKGTGFVHSGELPMSDDEDEEEEEESPAKKAAAGGKGVQINSNKQDAAPSPAGGAPQSKLARKGT